MGQGESAEDGNRKGDRDQQQKNEVEVLEQVTEFRQGVADKVREVPVTQGRNPDRLAVEIAGRTRMEFALTVSVIISESVARLYDR